MPFKKYSLSQAKLDLPQRNVRAHKATAGKALIIAGSQGMWGAAVLAAKACARCGAGYVYLQTANKKFPFQKNPDFLQYTPSLFHQMKAIGLGPGFKDPKKIRTWIQKLKKENHPLVLDAEALNVLAKMKNPRLPAHWILTPHEGELSRLLNVSSKLIQQNRKDFAKLAQRKYGCWVLLKGHHTLVAGPEKIYEIQSGNAALAKAGTGDVLTGMIVAFLCQGLSSEKAACLAAYLHGRIADQWIKNKKDLLSLTASDLIDHLAQEIYKTRPKSQLKAF